MYRDGGADFSEDDVDLMASLSPVLAEGFRRALLVTALADPPGNAPPGLILLDCNDATQPITPAAERLLDGVIEAGKPAEGERRLPAVVYAVAARARAAAERALAESFPIRGIRTEKFG